MTTGPNRILDDVAKLLTHTAGTIKSMTHEVKAALHNKTKKILNGMDVVKREEFEVLQDMLTKTCEENKKLAMQIKNLEKESKCSTKASIIVQSEKTPKTKNIAREVIKNEKKPLKEKKHLPKKQKTIQPQ